MQTAIMYFVIILSVLLPCCVAVLPRCIGKCIGRQLPRPFSDLGYEADAGRHLLINFLVWMRENGGSSAASKFKRHGPECCKAWSKELVRRAVEYYHKDIVNQHSKGVIYSEVKHSDVPKEIYSITGADLTPEIVACSIKIYMKSIIGGVIPIRLENVKDFSESGSRKAYRMDAILAKIPRENRIVLDPLLSYLNELLAGEVAPELTVSAFATELVPVIFPRPMTNTPEGMLNDNYVDARNILSMLIENPTWLSTPPPEPQDAPRQPEEPGESHPATLPRTGFCKDVGNNFQRGGKWRRPLHESQLALHQYKPLPPRRNSIPNHYDVPSNSIQVSHHNEVPRDNIRVSHIYDVPYGYLHEPNHHDVPSSNAIEEPRYQNFPNHLLKKKGESLGTNHERDGTRRRPHDSKQHHGSHQSSNHNNVAQGRSHSRDSNIYDTPRAESASLESASQESDSLANGESQNEGRTRVNSNGWTSIKKGTASKLKAKFEPTETHPRNI